MKWFKHDTNASRDTKLKKLKLRYGMEGYGLYWYLIERIVDNIEIHNLTFELEDDSEIISHDTNLHQDQVQEMMRYMVDLRLFECDEHNVITCLKIAKRLDQSMTSNPKMREKIAHIQHIIPDRVMIGSSEGHDSVMQEENRIEEKRIDKGRFTPPTLEEVTQYCNERKNSIDPQAFIDHYETNGWMRGKTKIKNWKACVRTWEKQNASQSDKDLEGAI